MVHSLPRKGKVRQKNGRRILRPKTIFCFITWTCKVVLQRGFPDKQLQKQHFLQGTAGGFRYKHVDRGPRLEELKNGGPAH